RWEHLRVVSFRAPGRRRTVPFSSGLAVPRPDGRLLSIHDESAYFEAAQAIGLNALDAYQRALDGTGATQRGEIPTKPRDPFLLRDTATILLDCGIRPDECF